MPTLQFSSLSEFVQMGTYSFHVWVVYLLFVLFVGYNLILPGVQRKQFIRQQKRRVARDAELATQAASRQGLNNRSAE
ncbi:heme exporter protein CcmD [Pseudohongiella sp.]|uniref:Cytochrome c-type biogenesis protein CcmD n=1 Tax=marine sediment metagenome TaxID=412755 RepID=A0A0F9Z0R4_9ZZZZ|nr:heme exporter protein CcmD [Pseudohongiella sp.]HDZ09920.1 heme exporter protein CcmD [Pseudohongiella sp.]HEA63666.1 heme exporter protein CcmD [Pseudohongiella sp.]